MSKQSDDRSRLMPTKEKPFLNKTFIMSRMAFHIGLATFRDPWWAVYSEQGSEHIHVFVIEFIRTPISDVIQWTVGPIALGVLWLKKNRNESEKVGTEW